MDRLWILAAALLFSTGGAAIKGNSLTGWQVASFRSLIAALALALLFPAARRNWTWRHLLVAVAYASMLVSFVAATKKTTAANAIFLQSTAPAWLVVLSPLLLKERLRREDLYVLLGVSAGMALFFVGAEPARATAPDPATGNAIGLLSGFVWALTLLGLRWLGRREDGAIAGLTTLLPGNLLAFVGALPFALPLPDFTLQDAAVLLYLGIFQIAFAYYCLTLAMRTVPALEAATLLLIEPALNPVWTWLILRERPAAAAIAGGAVILTSTIAGTWYQSRTAATRVPPSGAASQN